MATSLDKAHKDFAAAKWKTTGDYEKEAHDKKYPKGVLPTKKQVEDKQLSNEYKKDPEAFVKKEQMYDSAIKQDKEDYSPLNTLGEALKSLVNKKQGGSIKKMAKGGTASSRADGCATKGKTRGRMV
jgi:hypothetical protein